MPNWKGDTAVEKLNFCIKAFDLTMSTNQLTFEKEIFRMGVLLTIKGFFFSSPQQNEAYCPTLLILSVE